MENEVEDAPTNRVMRLDYEESCKGFKVPVLYHENNGKSLKDMGNGLGVGKDDGRRSHCTNSGEKW